MDEPRDDDVDPVLITVDGWIEALGLSEDAGVIFRAALEANDGDVMRALGGLAQEHVRLQASISRGYGRG